jgi:TonB family protein
VPLYQLPSRLTNLILLGVATIALPYFAPSAAQADPTAPPARTLGTVKACPVTIRDFSISGIGSTHGFVEYRIGVLASGHVPAVTNFMVWGDGDPTGQLITASNVDSRTDAVVFYWPTASLKRVSVASVERSGPADECDASSTIERKPRAPLISDKGAPLEAGEENMSPSLLAELALIDDAARRYVPAFDDSFLGAASHAGFALREARVLKHVMPDYPDIARETGEEGDELVAVTVGRGGSVLSVNIVKSSAGPMLNGTALTAARRTPYSEPELDSRPATRTYVIVMCFRLDGLTGLQFADASGP